MIDVPAQDGVWTNWTPWTDCSRTCKPLPPWSSKTLPGDLARKYRTRTCTNPPPADGGEDCKGLDEDVELCNQDNPCGKLRFHYNHKLIYVHLYIYGMEEFAFNVVTFLHHLILDLYVN